MADLSPDTITIMNSALNKLTGFKRRQYSVELCKLFFDNSARKMERVLKVSRAMIELGQHEERTGIRCLELFSQRGAKKKSSQTKI